MKKIIYLAIVFITITFLTIGQLTQKAQSYDSSSSLLLSEGERELSLMRTSFYQHQTDVDEASGRFNYDCSGFLDYALQKVSPLAYAQLPISKPKSRRPLAQDFYNLFSSRSTKSSSHWQHIRKLNNVHAGDVVAWLRPIDNDSNNTGHVMLVKGEPRLNPQRNDEILISVIDSTSSPHAQDSRRKGQTGLGSGTIGILVNRKSEPIAYRWRGGKSEREEQTSITFGRLR
jgi:hypothetical protein